MTKEYNFGEYQKDTLTRPRDEAWSNWKSWKGTEIGEKVQGYVADAFYRSEEKNDDGSIAFRAQRGITVRQVDGTLINVGIKDIDFILVSTDKLRVGDPVTIELTKILVAAKKGQQGAKVFSYYGANLDANKDNQTVKALTDEDRKTGGTREISEEEVSADGEYDSYNEEPATV